MATKKVLRNKIIIVGSGRLGSSIANKYSQQGKNVMVVDIEKENFDKLSENFMGYTFTGNAMDLALLEKAGIATAKQLIIATGDDNINLFVAHVASKIYEVPQVYVRLDDPDNEQLLKGFNIKAIFPFELSIDEFNRLNSGGNK